MGTILHQRRFQVLALLILVAPIQYYFADREIGGSTIRRGRTAPAAQAFTTAGLAWSPSDDAGRVVVLSFWATWCGPCTRELPVLDSLRRQLDSTDAVRFYALNVRESPDVADAYMTSAGLALPVLYDVSGRITSAFGVTALPTVIVLDRKSKVRWVEVGYELWGIPALARVVNDLVPGAFGDVRTPENVIMERVQKERMQKRLQGAGTERSPDEQTQDTVESVP